MDAGEGSSSSSGSVRPSVVLHVVSPSLEVPDKLTFPNVAASTTVAEVKKLIQEAVSSHPGPERQRLIYGGKPLLRPDMTLEALFGVDAISDSGIFTLHLVLPPPQTSSQAHRQSQRVPGPSASVNIPRPTVLHNPQSSSFPSVMSPPRPASTGQLPRELRDPSSNTALPGLSPSGQQNMAHSVFSPSPQGHTEDQARFTVRPQTASGQTRHIPRLAGFNNPHAGHHGFPPHFQNGLPFPPPFPAFGGMANQFQMPPFNDFVQQEIARHQQLASQGHSSGDANGASQQTDIGTQTSQGLDQSHGSGQRQQNHRFPPPNLPGTTIIREGQAPGGQWRMVINQTTFGPSPLPNHHHREPGQGASGSSQNPDGDSGNFTNGVHPAQSHTHNQTMHFPHPGMPHQVHDQATNAMTGIYAPSVPPQQGEPMVYLLSSPAGPQALLLSSNEVYSSPGLLPESNPVRHVPFHQPHNWPGIAPLTGSAVPNFTPTAFPPPNGASNSGSAPIPSHGVDNGARPPPELNLAAPQLPEIAVPQPEDRPAPAAGEGAGGGEAQAQDQANEDIWRVLAPIGGHIWLFIRLFGIVYLFTSGTSWSRTIVVCLIAMVVFAAQTAALQPLIQALWTPLRRHFEDLVHDVDMRPREGTPARPQRERQGNEGPGGPGTPQQLANRLLRDRQTRENSVAQNSAFRATYRRIERAVALFVTSLIPGVGERHVAAATEAARRAREREETARREQEEEEGRIRQREQQQTEDRRKGKEVEEKKESPMREGNATAVETMTTNELQKRHSSDRQAYVEDENEVN